MRAGPGTAICAGLLVSLLAHWVAGGDPWQGAHHLAVFALRVSMVLAALSLHEWAHAFAAYVLGDTTARDQGRMTLDPRSHFDATGLLIVPGILTAIGSPVTVGWAKPVPVNFRRLRRPRLGGAVVAAAGPASNIAAAAAISCFLHLLDVDGSRSLFGSAAWTFVIVNLGLGLFNLLPLYPMDGGRILAFSLPRNAAEWLERHERKAALAAVALLVVLPLAGAALGVGLSPLAPVQAAMESGAAFLTWSPDGSWYGPMQAWSETRK